MQISRLLLISRPFIVILPNTGNDSKITIHRDSLPFSLQNTATNHILPYKECEITISNYILNKGKSASRLSIALYIKAN